MNNKQIEFVKKVYPAAERLAKAGGVSVTALVVSLSVVLGIYLLLSFMALAPLMAAPMAGLAV